MLPGARECQLYPILSDRTSVVTGAGSGMGRAIALSLAERGAQVICGDIRKKS